MQNGWSRKVYLKLEPPAPEDNRPDSERILEAVGKLPEFSGKQLRMGISALRARFPCRPTERAS